MSNIHRLPNCTLPAECTGSERMRALCRTDSNARDMAARIAANNTLASLDPLFRQITRALEASVNGAIELDRARRDCDTAAAHVAARHVHLEAQTAQLLAWSVTNELKRALDDELRRAFEQR